MRIEQPPPNGYNMQRQDERKGIMRFLIGLLGGVVAGVVTMAVLFAIAGHSMTHALAGVGALVVPEGHPGPVTGAIIVIVFCSLLGSVFTSGMCGRMASGPAIGVGLAYGFLVWLFIVTLLLPTLIEGPPLPFRSSTIALTSLLFGALMGVWVIVAAHIWPVMSARCQGPSEGTEGTDEEE
jgi:uncharacterized membrane protein YagU involved in acid resistance